MGRVRRTKRERLYAPRAHWGARDKQRLFRLRVEGQSLPCPACARPINAFVAAGITSDDYDFGQTEYSFRCPHWAAVLEQVVPAFSSGPFWTWPRKDDWRHRQLAKARATDARAPTQGEPHGS